MNENMKVVEDNFLEDFEYEICKWKFWKRVNIVYVDYDYFRLLDEVNKVELDDDGLYEKVELFEEDDEEFRFSCSLVKKFCFLKNIKN